MMGREEMFISLLEKGPNLAVKVNPKPKGLIQHKIKSIISDIVTVGGRGSEFRRKSSQSENVS